MSSENKYINYKKLGNVRNKKKYKCNRVETSHPRKYHKKQKTKTKNQDLIRKFFTVDTG